MSFAIFDEVQNIDINAEPDDFGPPPPDSDTFNSADPRVRGHVVIGELVAPEMTEPSDPTAAETFRQQRAYLNTNFGDKACFIKFDKGGNPMLTLKMKVEAEGEPYHHAMLSDWPSARMNNNNTTMLDSLVYALVGQKPAMLSVKEKLALAIQGIQSGKQFRARTQWQASPTDSDANGKRPVKYKGYNNKMFTQNGAQRPLKSDPITGAELRTDARILGYNPL